MLSMIAWLVYVLNKLCLDLGTMHLFLVLGWGKVHASHFSFGL